MNARTWMSILAVLLWVSACTRPYSIAPIPEVTQPGQAQAPDPTQAAALTAQVVFPQLATQTAVAAGQPPGDQQPAEGQTGGAMYVTQPGSPVRMGNTMHPEAACNWMGIAGQVFNIQLSPVENLAIVVGGVLDGAPVNKVSLTGQAPQYGPGGYEVVLGDRPIASSQALWIQVLDLEGRQLSEQVYFDTSGDCEQNLVMMNFVQTITGVINNYFLPFVAR